MQRYACQELLKSSNKKPTATRYSQPVIPMQVLTGPDVALLPRSDEIGCIQRGMAVDDLDGFWRPFMRYALSNFQSMRRFNNSARMMVSYLSVFCIWCGNFRGQVRISFCEWRVQARSVLKLVKISSEEVQNWPSAFGWTRSVLRLCLI